VWTTFHLGQERRAAGILGIPDDKVMQRRFIPVAYTIGTELTPVLPRGPPDPWSTGTAGEALVTCWLWAIRDYTGTMRMLKVWRVASAA
jgi:hypothetical protein